jgi:hypothetical protein
MNEHFKRTGPAVEAHYQFLLWLVPTVDRFPKSACLRGSILLHCICLLLALTGPADRAD